MVYSQVKVLRYADRDGSCDTKIETGLINVFRIQNNFIIFIIIPISEANKYTYKMINKTTSSKKEVFWIPVNSLKNTSAVKLNLVYALLDQG